MQRLDLPDLRDNLERLSRQMTLCNLLLDQGTIPAMARDQILGVIRAAQRCVVALEQLPNETEVRVNTALGEATLTSLAEAGGSTAIPDHLPEDFT
jgi:hypothetical protein